MISLKNIFHKFKRPQGTGGALWNPERDWKRFIVIFACINLLVAGAALYMFYKVQAGEFFRVPFEKPELGKTIDRTLLEGTIKTFDSRSEEFKTLEATGAIPPDPSL